MIAPQRLRGYQTAYLRAELHPTTCTAWTGFRALHILLFQRGNPAGYINSYASNCLVISCRLLWKRLQGRRQKHRFNVKTGKVRPSARSSEICRWCLAFSWRVKEHTFYYACLFHYPAPFQLFLIKNFHQELFTGLAIWCFQRCQCNACLGGR